MQSRFVRLTGHILKYYKTDSADEKELGSANMLTAEFVRTFDSSSSCTVFEVQDDDRVYIFQAQTHSEMQRWMSNLLQARSVVQAAHASEIQSKVIADTPLRIRCFDESGEEEFVVNITYDLIDIYPERESPEYKLLSLRQHVMCASDLSEYLREFVVETQKTSLRPARYDVLAVMLREVNAALVDRMDPILSCLSEEGAAIHELLEQALLGDIHCLIDWLTKYQISLRAIVCPVVATTTTNNYRLSPKSCILFDYLSDLCHIYMYGGTDGSGEGAAAHLYDHCYKVWESVLRNPEEMLQKHQNGTFYTHSPIAIWEAINQHISLAMSTQSSILHVMVADKVVSSLNPLVNNIIEFVDKLSSTSSCNERGGGGGEQLKEIELEFISALANDTAIHIEEVVELIGTFGLDEIRDRIDEIFDPLTTNLVNCGQACLNRLAKLVMLDVHGLLDEIFTPAWLEGQQVSVAISTVSDYMADFEEFLSDFWAVKFVHTILEEVILSYIRSILFPQRRPVETPKVITPVSVDNNSAKPKGGMFSSFFKGAKEKVQEVVHLVKKTSFQCAVDPESLGRLAQDTNTLNSFFSKKAGQEVAADFLEIMNEVSLMLYTDYDQIFKHTLARISEFPSAAEVNFNMTSFKHKLIQFSLL